MSSSYVTYRMGPSLTHTFVPEVRKILVEVIRDFNGDIILDCQDMVQVDGDGIGLLAWLKHHLLLDKRELMLDNVSDQPRAMFRVLGILEQLVET